MIKSILVPIDGGKLSDRAISASIELAAQLGASLTGFAVGSSKGLLASQARNAESAIESIGGPRAAAREALARFEQSAQAAGVPYQGFYHQASRVDRAIIEAAESHGCDMILMVTHGRGAFGEFLFGSQTKAVLAGSNLPLVILK
jgi:nucleotide-binding universal stress UspA family protein